MAGRVGHDQEAAGAPIQVPVKGLLRGLLLTNPAWPATRKGGIYMTPRTVPAPRILERSKWQWTIESFVQLCP